MKKSEIKTLTKQFILQKLSCIYDGNAYALLSELQKDECRETLFWSTCKDVAYEVLSRNTIWYELSNKIDFLAEIVEDEIVKNLSKWLENNMAITKNLDNLENLLNWLFARYIAILKNTTDARYKMHIRLEVVEFEEEKSFNDEMSTIDKVILDSFANYPETEKISIFQKVGDDALDDWDFDTEDMQYLCKKYNVPFASTFINCELKIPTVLEQSKDGLNQLIINFNEVAYEN